MKTRAFWARQRARQNKRVIVPQRAVRKFLARDRRDYNRYRTKSLQWLERRIMRLPVRPPIWKALRKEQRVGLVAGVETQKFCYWYDMGMGKTMLAIALTRYFERVGIVKRVLVLIPNKVNKNEWAVQIKKHSPKSTYTILRGSSLQKWEQLESAQTTFILETYGGLVRMLSKMVTNKKNKNKLKPHLTFVKRLLRQIQGIVMDESIMITRKDRHGSIMHRLCRKIAKTVDVAFALNGTPFGRDPTDMWGQFHVIDEGETLGETLGLFRATFFKATANYWGGFDYRFDKKHEKLLHEIIGNRSIRYEADESTLPKVVPIVKPVSMPNGADEFYEKAKEAVIASRGNYEEMQNAFLRMRQISSGFIGYDDDELGTRAQFEFTPNPKKELLLSDLQSITPTNKAVVFHEFTFSGDMIERMLKQAKIPYARLYGKTKDPDKAISKFHDDPKCRVFILQNSMAIGLDRLKVAKYGLYFESPGKTYMRVQSLRRIRRQGSEHDHVFIIDYVVNGTVDQDILDAHEQGIDLFEAIVEGKRRLR
jgi:SNF2 family DNA or RNA helicase